MKVLGRNFNNSIKNILIAMILTFQFFLTTCGRYNFQLRNSQVLGKDRINSFLKSGEYEIRGIGTISNNVEGKKSSFKFKITIDDMSIYKLLIYDQIGRLISKVVVNGNDYSIWTRDNKTYNGRGIFQWELIPFLIIKVDYIGNLLLARDINDIGISSEYLLKQKPFVKNMVIHQDECNLRIEYGDYKFLEGVIFPGVVKINCDDFGFELKLEYRKIKYKKDFLTIM
ncbi:MAG: hypothetical protein H0Z29_01735 [Candidatus Marinimicrobia bacterium]|nr:hypothetical protein [Candidatus Neomarinimicrobiota bacterium]